MEYLKQVVTFDDGAESKTYWYALNGSRESMKKALIANGLSSVAAMDLKRDGTVKLIYNDGTITFELTQEKPSEG